MNPQFDPTDIGRQLGTDGVNGVVTKAEEYCSCEAQRIALKNLPGIVSLRAQLSLLAKEAQGLEDQLRDAPPPGDLRRHRQRAIFYWAVTISLTVIGFFLAHMTLDPFRLGWQSYLLAAGIAIVLPFLVHKLLEDIQWEAVIKGLTAIAAVAGIASLMLFADIRGRLLAHETQSVLVVTFDDAQPDQPAQDDFYNQTLDPLRWATMLLSLAMELGAGLALHKAWAPAPHNAADWKLLRGSLAAVHQQMVLAVAETSRLEAEPALFRARFWRDFFASMLTHTVESAMTKLVAVVAVVLLLTPFAHASTPPAHTNLVIAIDLSKSVDVKGPDGSTEFQKNVEGVTRLLAEVSVRTHVTVIGITDRSFAQPYILLSATVPEDEGYFGERLTAARQALVREWKRRSMSLAPKFPGTDILGVLELAGQIFDQKPVSDDRRILVILSDMRNHTCELDLERKTGIVLAMRQLSHKGLPDSDMRGADVYALGVDGAGENPEDWREVDSFWSAYLRQCGSALTRYSTLRDMDEQTLR